MSDQDILTRSFSNSLSEADLDLTDRDKALLVKLFSNTAFIPDLFKTWLAGILPVIGVDLPISNISGFLKIARLQDYPDDDRKFLRGDGKWVEIAGALTETWDETTVDWDSPTTTWDG